LGCWPRHPFMSAPECPAPHPLKLTSRPSLMLTSSSNDVFAPESRRVNIISS
jgi:hypothetical protein